MIFAYFTTEGNWAREKGNVNTASYTISAESNANYTFDFDYSDLATNKVANPEAKLFKLERNYRSTENIVKAANSLIKKNNQRIPKTLYSNNESGHLIKVYKSHYIHNQIFCVLKCKLLYCHS